MLESTAHETNGSHFQRYWFGPSIFESCRARSQAHTGRTKYQAHHLEQSWPGMEHLEQGRCSALRRILLHFPHPAFRCSLSPRTEMILIWTGQSWKGHAEGELQVAPMGGPTLKGLQQQWGLPKCTQLLAQSKSLLSCSQQNIQNLGHSNALACQYFSGSGPGFTRMERLEEEWKPENSLKPPSAWKCALKFAPKFWEILG